MYESSFLILSGMVLTFTAVAATLDIRTRRLPNWLTVPMFFSGVVYHTATDGLAGFGFAMGGFAIGFGLLLILWLTGGGGGGDVKMMGALGAWLGGPLTVMVFVGSGVLALLGLFALRIWKLISSSSEPTSKSDADGEGIRRAEKARQMIPYAVPVTIATWMVVGMKWLSILSKQAA